MTRFSHFSLLLSALCLGVLSGCAAARSDVPFIGASGRRVPLAALCSEAKKGVLVGPDSTAWFSFNPARAGTEATGDVAGRLAIEVAVRSEGVDPVRFSFGFVTGSDLTSRGTLRDGLPARPLSVVSGATGEVHIRMLTSVDEGSPDILGFAIALEGASESRAVILSASVETAETGWQKTPPFLWVGFGSAGGSVDCAEITRVPARLVPGSLLSVYLDSAGAALGTMLRQNRLVFSTGGRTVGFRHSPAPCVAYLPSCLVPEAPALINPVSGAANLTGLRISYGRPLAVADDSNFFSLILCDPHMIIEWPVASWRRSDYEIFAWDRFPSILIFDTADYAVQDRLFKRLAFFVEKHGYRGMLLSDGELAPLRGYNAHDYRAESLAAFFEEARKSGFPLNPDETKLRDALLSEGVIRTEGSAYVPGAGAVLSFSRESAAYLRYLFMAHEGFHGIYFVDPDFRAEVASVYRSMDSRAIEFLAGYFTVVDGLGYDTNDAYLMENEFMAYLMQQPESRVGQYFTETIMERFLRYGGDTALAEYVRATKASEFLRAAHALNEYVFGRWGIAGGRIGLYFAD